MRWHLYNAGLLVFGLAMIALGIVILVQGNVVLTYAALIGGIVILIHSGHCFLNFILKRNDKN